MKRRPVAVRWHDAAHIQPGEWCTALPDDTAVLVTTVGVLVRKSKTHLVVAQSVDDSGNLTGVFSIPRTNVVQMWRLTDK